MSTRIALAALLFVLTACGSSTSVADPPLPGSPTTSATPQPAKRETPQHFIRRWAAEEARMENTGDTSVYLALSPGCHACHALAARIRHIYAAGGYVKWGGKQILSISTNRTHRHHASFNVRSRSLPTTYRESAHGPIKHLPGGVATDLLNLSRVDASWRLTYRIGLAS